MVIFLKNLKNTSQQKKFSDGGGLYIYLRDSGAKLWQMSYRFNGKQKILSFGEYPYVSLKQAREKREEAKTLLAAGADPGELKKADKQAEIAKIENTFEAVGREWFARNSQNWTEAYSKRVIFGVENNLFPFIGAKDISEIKTAELL